MTILTTANYLSFNHIIFFALKKVKKSSLFCFVTFWIISLFLSLND